MDTSLWPPTSDNSHSAHTVETSSGEREREGGRGRMRERGGGRERERRGEEKRKGI